MDFSSREKSDIRTAALGGLQVPYSPNENLPLPIVETSPAYMATLDIAERLHRLPDTVALTTAEAAIFLRCSVTMLERLRSSGLGPPYIQGGVKGSGTNQRCLYEKTDLLAWIRSLKVNSKMEAAIRKGQV